LGCLTSLLVAAATVAWAAEPANAAGPATAPVAIDQFFKQRDLAWYGSVRPLATGDLPAVSAQAQREIDQVAEMARTFRAETGISAEDVETTTTSESSVSTCDQWALDVTRAEEN